MIDYMRLTEMSGISYPEIVKWLTGKKKSTKHSYTSGMDAYIEYIKLNPTQLIDEAEADREKKVRERGVPEQRLKGFREWLLTEYRQKTRGSRDPNKRRLDKIGVSEKLALTYCAAIKGFYRDNGFPLDLKLGKARKKTENFKIVIRGPEISKLLSAATSLRDKAIVKFMYESTQGVSEVCSPNYGDIHRHEEDGMEVWQFHTIRKKTKTEYWTEIGEECIELLTLYFAERKRTGEKLTELSPLFVKEGRQKLSRQRITPNLIEATLKTLAIKSGLVTEEAMAKADINPCRPHALRAGGMSVLKLAGYNEEAVEFRAGHELSEQRQAYWLTRPEELRERFRKHYDSLRIKGTTQFDIQEVKKLRDMLAEKEITVQALAENGKLKVIELQRLREQLEEQRKTINKIEQSYGKELDSLTKKYDNIKKFLEKEEKEPAWMSEFRERMDTIEKLLQEKYPNMKQQIQESTAQVVKNIQEG